MYEFQEQVPVRLQFRSMSTSIAISVPGHVLRYLDRHAQRTFAEDGTAIYWQMPYPIPLSRTHRRPDGQTVLSI